MSAEVELQNVSIAFGNFYAAKNVNVKIGAGEFFSFLGPSGCGKTTLLRAVSGFLEPSQGKVLIDGQDMSGIGPNKRPTSLIFQNLALFPLMSVADNIAFSLEVRGHDKASRRKRADELLDLVALNGQGDKKVHELSGGQKQRVAIGRAIVREPSIYLFDEPLSNLDAELRVATRVELKALHARLGNTMIYVTHDQVEAMTMADKIVVMNDGIIEQVGAPLELYNKPSNKFVAGFIGSPKMNFIQFDYLPNSLKEIAPSNSISLGIRPEHLSIKDENSLSLNVETVEQLGSDSFLYGSTLGEQKISIKLNYQTDIQANQSIKVGFKLDDAHWFDKDGIALTS